MWRVVGVCGLDRDFDCVFGVGNFEEFVNSIVFNVTLHFDTFYAITLDRNSDVTKNMETSVALCL